MAQIGVGGMGNAHLEWYAACEDVDIVAICDVDDAHIATTLANLERLRPGAKVDTYRDFRHVLDRPDIDVVSCATPDHWHAIIAIMAFAAGKDVYGEKPLSHTLEESYAMVEAQRRTGRVFQLGTQIHAGDNYHRAAELIRSGVLGPIHEVNLWMNGGSPGCGFPPDGDPPATLDWDLWLGPASRVPYNPAKCHGTFRYFWDYSGGVYADFWCHIADIAYWALDLRAAPRTIAARGETPGDGIADTPAWIDVDNEFDDLRLNWTSRTPDLPGAAGKVIGAQFVGENGTMVVDYGTRVLFLDGEELTDLPDVPQSLPRSPGHVRNFLDCVKTREQPESNLECVHRMTLPMHLGCASFRVGRELTWDGQNRCFVGDDEATRLLSKSYRAPWSLPTV